MPITYYSEAEHFAALIKAHETERLACADIACDMPTKTASGDVADAEAAMATRIADAIILRGKSK